MVGSLALAIMVGSLALALLMPGAGGVLADWRIQQHAPILQDSNEDQS